ncbi:MAG TPA: FG-GAP-like repeat-containing protein [Thermohalobaculum sp.]|nr:FG-GAP-like repeat-containing protein [Thermohalobaculum sp.]
MRPLDRPPSEKFPPQNFPFDKIPFDRMSERALEHVPFLDGAAPDLDVFVANADGVNQILSNDSSGTFTAAIAPGGSLDSRGVALGDLDGDGDLDAFVANSVTNQILTNDGYGISQ